jgi:glycosyltransferase involved in cell wall biosynthesis
MITYNHELYIAKAIEGVLNQKTNFLFELVIGEDCSTDNTKKIVLEYQRKFPHIIKVITSSNNVGMIKNSIRTALACDGKYIAYCEGDDYWHNPDKLQIQVDFLEHNPEYGMVHSNADLFDTRSGKLHDSYLKLIADLDDANAYFEILTDTRHVFTPTVCVRRDLLVDIIKNNPECSSERFLMGDLQIWLEISHVSKVKYFPESLATYNFLEESATQSKNPIKLLQFEQSFKELILLYLAKYDCPEEIRRQALSRITPTLLRLAIFANDRSVIKREIVEMRSLGLEKSLNWRERLICWCSDSVIKFSLILCIKKIWAIIKRP